MAISTNRQMLVETEWVEANLDRPDIRVLDVDEDTEAYGRAHLPGALGIHWRNDLQDPMRRDFVGPAAFAALMDRLGIGNDTLVVLYGGNNNWFAAYAYWYFKFYGHGPVKLMDGGRKKWELEKRRLTSGAAETTATAGYRVGSVANEIRALRRRVEEEVVGHPEVGLVDVRSPEEYRASCWRRRTCPRSKPRSQATYLVPGTSRGPRRSTRRQEPFCLRRSCELSTRARASRPTAKSSLTAGSASAAPTPGSSSTSCSPTRAYATTTAPGPNGAHWSALRSSAERSEHEHERPFRIGQLDRHQR